MGRSILYYIHLKRDVEFEQYYIKRLSSKQCIKNRSCDGCDSAISMGFFYSVLCAPPETVRPSVLSKGIMECRVFITE